MAKYWHIFCIPLAYLWHTFGISLTYHGIYLAYLWHIFGMSLAYLWHIFIISVSYLWHIYSIYLEYLLHIFGISVAYLWHIFGISLAYIWHIFGKYLANIWHIFGIYSAYLWHISRVCFAYLYYIFSLSFAYILHCLAYFKGYFHRRPNPLGHSTMIFTMYSLCNMYNILYTIILHITDCTFICAPYSLHLNKLTRLILLEYVQSTPNHILHNLIISQWYMLGTIFTMIYTLDLYYFILYNLSSIITYSQHSFYFNMFYVLSAH